MCDIEDVVRKITPVFNILSPFCPRLSGDHFAQEHKTRVCMSSVSTKKKIYQSYACRHGIRLTIRVN